MKSKNVITGLFSAFILFSCTKNDLNTIEELDRLNAKNTIELADGLNFPDFIDECNYDNLFVIYSIEEYNHPDFIEARATFIDSLTQEENVLQISPIICPEFKIPNTINIQYFNALDTLFSFEGNTNAVVGNQEGYYEKWNRKTFLGNPQSGSIMDVDLDFDDE